MKRREGSFLRAGTIFRFVFAAVMLFVSLSMFTYLKLNPELAGNLTNLTRAAGMIISGASFYVKFNIGELMLSVAVLLAALYVVVVIYKMITAKHIGARLLRVLSNILALGMLCFVMHFMIYGVNYLAPSKTDSMGVEPQTIDARSLEVLTKYLQNKANEYASSMPRDLSGSCEFGDLATKSSLVISAYEGLAYKYKFISGTFAPAKTTSSSTIMKKLGKSGGYLPITGEVTVDKTQPEPYMVFSIAKAFANRLSVANESDANYVAFEICSESSDRRVAYAAYFMAYRYCISALSEIDTERAAVVRADMNESLTVDIIQYKEYIQGTNGRLARCVRWLENKYMHLMGFQSKTYEDTRFVEYLLGKYSKIL